MKWVWAGMVFMLAVVGGHGCASFPDVDPEVALVSWVDLERGRSTTLVSRGFGDYERLYRTGRLDPTVKIIDPKTMGVMVRVLEDYHFFERAIPVSPDSPQLIGRTPQIISFRNENGVLTLNFIPTPGQDNEKKAWDEDFVTIKNGILDIHRRTAQYTLVPSKRVR